MKEKILAAFKAKFPKVNLSKPRLNALAAKIEAKVIDDETKIDAELDAHNDYFPFADLAKQDDKLRDLEAKAKASTSTKDSKEKTDPVIEEPVITDDTPAWAKALIEQNKKLSEGFAALQGEKQAGTIKSKLAAKFSEKGKEIPEVIWGKRRLPEKEEELEEFETDVRNDWAALTKESTDKGLSALGQPKSGTGGGASDKKPATKEEVTAVLKDIM